MLNTILLYLAYMLFIVFGLAAIYLLLRVGSLAIFRSWSQVKVEHLKKLWLGRYKDKDPNSGGLDNETRRKDWN